MQDSSSITTHGHDGMGVFALEAEVVGIMVHDTNRHFIPPSSASNEGDVLHRAAEQTDKRFGIEHCLGES